MRATTTAANLNLMIQAHIDARAEGEYTWHTDVYLHAPGVTGCNWNVAVNCNKDLPVCGASISDYLDEMRDAYLIPVNDTTAIRAHDTARNLAGQVRSAPDGFASSPFQAAAAA